MNVDIAAKQADARAGGIDDSVLFRVHGATDFVIAPRWDAEVFAQAKPMFDGAFGAPWRAVVTRGHHLVVFNNDRAEFHLGAGAAFGNGLGQFQVVFIFAGA